VKLALIFLVGCAYGSTVKQYTPTGTSNTVGQSAGLADFRCDGSPEDLPRGIRHWRNRHLWTLAQSQHRGFDVIAMAGDAQYYGGKLAHSIFDKSIQDEDVTLYGCEAAGWRKLGTARTDDDGRFQLKAELGVGLHDVFAAAPDGDDFRFLAYIGPRGAPLVVADIDGTLTHSEGAFPKQVLFGRDVYAQRGAADALQQANLAGYQLVYITARGDRFTDATRRWLVEHGFPRGPMRLGRPMFVMPGIETVEYKWSTLVSLRTKFAVAAALGNRRSDVEAYRMAGLPARRTFVKLPEFTQELEAELAAHRAIGFAQYGPLPLPPQVHTSRR
jgi:hypothetical protein